MQTSKLLVETPALQRRLACLVYEFFLVVAVAALGTLIFSVLAQSMSSSFIEHGRQLMVFVIVGLYLVHAWTGAGFTLAMKTWRIKIVKVGHARVPYTSAVLRYLLAWGWFLPALTVSYLAHFTRGQTGIALGIGVLVWALTAFLDKDRQFLHDKLAGTRLISLPKLTRSGKTQAPAASA